MLSGIGRVRRAFDNPRPSEPRRRVAPRTHPQRPQPAVVDDLACTGDLVTARVPHHAPQAVLAWGASRAPAYARNRPSHTKQISERAHTALAASASSEARWPANPHSPAPASTTSPRRNPVDSIATATPPATRTPPKGTSTAAGCARDLFSGESDGSDFQYSGRLCTFGEPHFPLGQIATPPDARREPAPCRWGAGAAPLPAGL